MADAGQRYPKCKGCAAYRGKVSPRLLSCKGVRLCELVDVSLLSRRPHQRIDEYLKMAQAITTGHAFASLLAGRIPRDPERFLPYILELHQNIFGEGLPEIAGRFRRRARTRSSAATATTS